MTDYFAVQLPPEQIRAISSIGLAHLGDAVFELLVRTWLCAGGKATGRGLHRATVALEIFEYRVRKMIAEYAAAMGGVDVVVFTAGVGENAPETRAHILQGLEFMGITCDPEKNNCRGKEQIISQDGAPVIVMVIPTNEELMIAQDTMELVLDQE